MRASANVADGKFVANFRRPRFDVVKAALDDEIAIKTYFRRGQMELLGLRPGPLLMRFAAIVSELHFVDFYATFLSRN